MADIEDIPKRSVKPLSENNINTVSDLLNSEEERLIEIKGISEKSLEKIYDAVQSFVEKNQAVENSKTEEAETEESSSLLNKEVLEKVES